MQEYYPDTLTNNVNLSNNYQLLDQNLQGIGCPKTFLDMYSVVQTTPEQITALTKNYEKLKPIIKALKKETKTLKEQHEALFQKIQSTEHDWYHKQRVMEYQNINWNLQQAKFDLTNYEHMQNLNKDLIPYYKSGHEYQQIGLRNGELNAQLYDLATHKTAKTALQQLPGIKSKMHSDYANLTKHKLIAEVITALDTQVQEEAAKHIESGVILSKELVAKLEEIKNKSPRDPEKLTRPEIKKEILKGAAGGVAREGAKIIGSNL
ncbi:hypothetical protein ACTFIR_002883 [Dictyostelium discoideum]